MFDERTELRSLLPQIKQMAFGESHDFMRAVVVSDSSSAVGVAFFGNEKRVIVEGFNPESQSVGSLSGEQCSMLCSAFAHLKNAECPWCSQKLLDMLLTVVKSGQGAAGMAAAHENGELVLLVGEPSISGCEPIICSKPQQRSLSFTYAIMEENKRGRQGWLVLSEEVLASYQYLSIYDVYQLILPVGVNQKYELHGELTEGVLDEDENALVATVRPMALKLLESKILKGLSSYNVDPIRMVQYLVECSEVGIEFSVEGEAFEDAESLYIVASVLRGLELVVDECILGDIRIGCQLEANKEFDDAYSALPGPKCTIWTYQRAYSFSEAQSKAKSRMLDVIALIEFIAKQDRVLSSYGMSSYPNEWNTSEAYLPIKLEDVFYIEDCDRSATIFNAGKSVDLTDTRKLDTRMAEQLKQPWVSHLTPTSRQENHYMIEAIKWLERSRNETSMLDSIISLNTAVEYCINEEQGTTVLAEALSQNGIKGDELNVDNMLEEIKSYMAGKLSAAKKGARNNVIGRIIGQLKTSMESCSFASRLSGMVERLGSPISEDEVNLIKRMHKIRNRALHGSKYELLNLTELQRATSAVGVIIATKMERVAERSRQ